jgi:hypothetical protein
LGLDEVPPFASILRSLHFSDPVLLE